MVRGSFDVVGMDFQEFTGHLITVFNHHQDPLFMDHLLYDRIHDLLHLEGLGFCV